MQIIEASFDITRKTMFANLFADCLFLYYIIMAGGRRTQDRRKRDRNAN